jgi:hypothetical protein
MTDHDALANAQAQRGPGEIGDRRRGTTALRGLLSDGGLEVVERYGELDRSSFTATSKRQVMVCGAAPNQT